MTILKFLVKYNFPMCQNRIKSNNCRSLLCCYLFTPPPIICWILYTYIFFLPSYESPKVFIREFGDCQRGQKIESNQIKWAINQSKARNYNCELWNNCHLIRCLAKKKKFRKARYGQKQFDAVQTNLGPTISWQL